MPTAKKKPVAKKAPAKKPVAKKAVAKKAPAKKASSRAASVSNNRAFMETRFTEQTVYWLIIGVAVIALAAWVLSLQVQLNEMYDSIDATNTSYVSPAKPEL
jgi:hypothetical protein